MEPYLLISRIDLVTIDWSVGWENDQSKLYLQIWHFQILK